MMIAEIQIQFPTPGVWDKMIMTAVYQDAEGYTLTDSYTQDDIPPALLPALESVVAALVGMGEPWQARQVWARLGIFYALVDDGPLREVETVVLTVEAVHAETGGRRMLWPEDYPEFFIQEPSAVEFFKYFTRA